MKKLSYITAAILVAIAGFIAGCGGGGGTTTAVNPADSGYGGLQNVRISFNGDSAANNTERQVLNGHGEDYIAVTPTSKMYQDCEGWRLSVSSYEDETSYYMVPPETMELSTGMIPVYLYVSKDAEGLMGSDSSQGYYRTANSNAKSPELSNDTTVNPIASACAILTCTGSGESMSCSGEFDIKNVLAGSNLLLDAETFVQETYGEQTYFYSDKHVAGLVESVVAGAYTTDVVISPTTTLVAKAAITYASNQGVALSAVPQASVDSISSSVNSMFSSGIQYGVTTYQESTIYNSYSFSSALVQAILIDAGLYGPLLSSFTPESGATIAYDAPSFTAVFDKSLDDSVTPSGFSAVITRYSTSNSFTINDTNATDYGSFSYTTTTNANDTLVYTLKSNSVLEAASLNTLAQNEQYTVSSFSLPTNIKDTSGNLWDYENDTAVPTTFTVYTAEQGPRLNSFTPASGDTITYDGPSFKAVFDESLDNLITPTGFSAVITRNSTSNTFTINDTNATDYGYFSYDTTTLTDDTLIYTLYDSSTLGESSLNTLLAGETYSVSSFSLPTNIQNTGGTAWNYSEDTLVPSSFSVSTYTGPVLLSTSPANGATGVAYDGPSFDFVFNMSLDPSSPPSGFSLTLERQSTANTITITSSNYTDYGSFSYVTTNLAYDTVRYTVKSNSMLSAAELQTISPGATYLVDTYSLPEDIVDMYGNTAYDPNSVIPASGIQFTTAGGE